MLITRFRHLRNAQGWQEEVPDDFLKSPVHVGTLLSGEADKESLELYSFGKFKDNYRHIRQFQSIDCIGFDVDVEPVTSVQLKETMARLGFAALWHSSANGSPENPRWRLFVPLSREVNADEYRAIWLHVESLLPFKVGQQAKDPVRAWYVPATRGEYFEYGEYVDAGPLDVDSLPPAAPVLPPTAPAVQMATVAFLDPSEEKHAALVAHLVANWPPKGKRHETHLALAGSLAKMGFSKDYAARVAYDVTLATGNDEATARRRVYQIERTFAMANTDQPILGWNKFCENVGAIPASQIHDVLGIRVLPDLPAAPAADPGPSVPGIAPPPPPRARLYRVGEVAAASVLRKVTHSEMAAFLVSHPDWQDVLRWNVLWNRPEALNPPIANLALARGQGLSDADETAILCWFESQGIKSTTSQVRECIIPVCHRTHWNPIALYLQQCALTHPEDGAIEEFCTKALHLPADDKLSRAMWRKQLIAACRRGVDAPMSEGVKVDTMLILKSKQGWNKTQTIEVLFGKSFVRSNLSDIKNKESSLELLGMWAIEFGELASLANNEVEHMREFSSRSTDKYRAPYGRGTLIVPRTCVFFGTTNAPEFLRDEAGNRRSWVCEIFEEIDLEWVKANRDRIWAEAYRASRTDERHWFAGDERWDAEDRARQYFVTDEWGDAVINHCRGKDKIQLVDLYKNGLRNGDPQAVEAFDMLKQKRLSKLLLHLGFEKRSNGNFRYWAVPDHIRDEIGRAHV